VEAGLRSGDMRMPEEINRLVTDSISDWFFCTEPSGVDNLLREGKSKDVVFHVGHVMVDNLLYQRDQLDGRQVGHGERGAQEAVRSTAWSRCTARPTWTTRPPRGIAGVARHRRRAAADLPGASAHPRQPRKVRPDLGPNVLLTKPQSYMEFLNLWKDAALILTDSGGLQEETTALGALPHAAREHRAPVTIDEGSNVLVGTDPARIREEAAKVLAGQGSRAAARRCGTARPLSASLPSSMCCSA
jgi:UDP-N-acetylglucosamine 2-epimerase (non-hydrolysing)